MCELGLGHSRVELAYSFDMGIVSQKDNIKIRKKKTRFALRKEGRIENTKIEDESSIK